MNEDIEDDFEDEDDELRDPRLEAIVEHYGREHQRWKLVEECGELIAELGRFKTSDRANVADLLHEAADVIVVARQLWPTERSVFWDYTFDDAIEALIFWTADLASALSEGTYELFGRRRTQYVEGWAYALAAQLEEELMLCRAIDMKIERQLERIAREAQEALK